MEVDPDVRTGLRECSMGRLPWPIFLLGAVGSGKTCAALALCDYTESPVMFLSGPELVNRLVDAKCGRLIEWTFAYGEDTKVSPRMLWLDWQQYNLCVIDDNSQRGTISDTAYEAIKEALDARVGKPLIVTSNVDLDVIEAVYDDRIASRLAAGTVLRIESDDRRLATATHPRKLT